jgi:hypothetical protein
MDKTLPAMYIFLCWKEYMKARLNGSLINGDIFLQKSTAGNFATLYIKN